MKVKRHKISPKVAGGFMILIGALLLAYILFGLSLGWGLYFGMAVMLAAGVLLLLAGVARLTGKSLLPAGRFIVLRRLFTCGVILLASAFIIVEGLIIASAVTFDDKKADYLLIPGAAVIGDAPSLELLSRLNRAVEYIRGYPETTVVVSGGQGPGENIAEADYMKTFLIGHGVDEKNIIVEDRSANTSENISFSRELIKKRDSRKDIKLAIATNDFHVFRAKLLAERAGFTAYGVPAPTPLYIIPNHYTREFFAVIKSILLD